MIKPVTLYAVICDKCKSQLIDDVCSAWYSESDAIEIAMNSEWLVEETGIVTCPNCLTP